MKNLKVGRKLQIGFGVVVILAIIIAVFGAINIIGVNNEYTYVLEFPFQGYDAVRDIEVGFMETRRIMNRAAMYIHDPDDPIGGINEQEQLFRARWADVDGYIANYRANLRADPVMTQEEIAEMLDDITAMETALHRYFNYYVLGLMNAARAGDEAETIRLVRQGVATVNEALEHLNSLYTAEHELMNTIGLELTEQSMITMWILIGIAAVAMIISVLLAVYISGLIRKPLVPLTSFFNRAAEMGDLAFEKSEQDAIDKYKQNKDELGLLSNAVVVFMHEINVEMEMLAKVADGDLTIVPNILSEKDVVGNSLTKVIGNLNDMFGEINSATRQVATGSKQIADGSQSLAQGSTEQAASVQQLSSSITEIAQKTKQNADMAERAAILANDIKGSAEKGSRQMDEMMVAVKDINISSQNISKVIKSIDDIAFQTNILALNAAVEAARAGQHGKGFAVVAEEVRNLAAKSAESAKDTERLIADSIEKAELGSRIADDTAASLSEIVAGIGESSQLVNEIAKSSEEQSVGIDQINKGVDQVAQVTQQNSATAEQSAAASQEMNSQSDMLEELISRFKLKDDASFARQSLPQVPTPASTPAEEPTSANDGDYGKY